MTLGLAGREQGWAAAREADAAFLAKEGAFWKNMLKQQVMPFWLEHALDPRGGINTCIKEDGSILNRDKWLWSQWRALWVFSRIYNSLDPDPIWLDRAKQIYDFVVDHGWMEKEQGWALCLGYDGKIKRGYESIYVDGFALYGLSELLKADPQLYEARLWLKRTLEGVLPKLKWPHDRIPHFPYPVAKGASMHGIPMIFSLILWETSEHLPEWGAREAALACSDDVWARFYQPDLGLILERVGHDGHKLPAPLGTAVVPGHAVESLWFQLHIMERSGDRERFPLALESILRHIEFGWDADHGGILLARNLHGADSVGWDYADYKLWWPHTEALYATFLGYFLTGDLRFREWYLKIKDYALNIFARDSTREWVQKTDRRGVVIEDTVALPVKDPFHLPRSLIMMVERAGSPGSDPDTAGSLP